MPPAGAVWLCLLVVWLTPACHRARTMPPSQETISNTLRSVLLAGGVVCGLVVVMLKSGVYFVFRLEDHRKMPGLDSRKLTYAQSCRVSCVVCRARALSPLISCVVYHMHFIHKLACTDDASAARPSFAVVSRQALRSLPSSEQTFASPLESPFGYVPSAVVVLQPPVSARHWLTMSTAHAATKDASPSKWEEQPTLSQQWQSQQRTTRFTRQHSAQASAK